MLEDVIYKINHLNVNQSKTEFSLCYENGIKTFDIKTFQEKQTSNSNLTILGDISFSAFTNEENILMFVGSSKNKDYPNNTLYFYDIEKKEQVFSKAFENPITQMKYVNNFIFICFDKELKIFYYQNEDLIEKDLIQSDKEYANLFEAWEKKEKYINSKLFLAYPYKKELTILYYQVDEWKLGEKINITSPVNKIQSLFYISKINQLFISDEKAIYIYGIDVTNGSVKLCLKRGTNPGFITSMTLLNDNFLAINNLNRTIHIFDLDINNNAFSFSNILYGMFGLQEIYPCIRIYFKELISGNEGHFHSSDFNKKGALLISEDDGNDLNIIAYNGYAYKVKINFQDKKKEEVLTKVEFTENKKDLKKISLFSSISDLDDKNNN
jgi:hypothetical protein